VETWRKEEWEECHRRSVQARRKEARPSAGRGRREKKGEKGEGEEKE